MPSFVRLLAAALAASTALTGAALADCEAFRPLEGKAWVDGSCMETPLGERWWPHPRWGEGDQAGSTNWYTRAEVVQRALAQVKRGQTLKLGQTYTADMPLFGERTFALRIPAAPSGGPLGSNRVLWNDEFVATEIGQVGTQFDGLGHIGVQIGADGDKRAMRFYNGFTAAELIGANGLQALGTERLHPIVARGVLIDVAAARGVEAMEAGDVITLADVRAALAKQGLGDFALQPGDAVLFRTGWERYWIQDNARYNAGAPGIGMLLLERTGEPPVLARGGAGRRDGRGHLARRRGSESRSRLRLLRPHLPAGAPRHREPGEPDPRRAGGAEGLPLRLPLYAGPDPRGDGLDRLPARPVVSGGAGALCLAAVSGCLASHGARQSLGPRELARDLRGRPREDSSMRPTLAPWLVVLAVASGGCATSGDLDALEQRLDALESKASANENRLRSLEERFADVASTADQSVRRAEKAEGEARSAAERADAAARKADAIFRKTVTK